MNPSAIFSKTGKGVQEASGKTSHLSRADRAVLAAIDGKSTLGEVQSKFDKIPEGKFAVLITQLDKDGFIREVTSGAQPATLKPAPLTTSKPSAAAAAKPAAPGKPPEPAPAAPAAAEGDELDFTQAIKIPAKPQIDLAAAARAEAQRQANEQQMSEMRKRQEAEARAQAEAEARMRVSLESDAKIKAARDAAVRAAAEAKAKAEAEAKAKAEAAERERKRAEERARKEAEEKAQLAARLEQERKAREEAERRAREAEEKARREAEEKAKREAEERARREAEEKARREAEAKARREAEERAKREAEEKARREAEARAKREAEEKARREAEEKARREAEERAKREAEERKKKEEAAAKAKATEEAANAEAFLAELAGSAKPEAPERKEDDAAAAKGKAAQEAAGAEAFLADLADFSKREDEERRVREEAESKAREQARARAKEAERVRKREEQEAQRRRDEERKHKEQQQQRAREEEERRAREEQEEEARRVDERKRKARELLAAKETEQRMHGAVDGDVVVGPEEIDMDEVEQDEKVLGKQEKKTARKREKEKQREKGRERERAKEREREREREEARAAKEEHAAPVRRGKPVDWGRFVTIALAVAVIGGLGALHLMPLPTDEYERAASQALGVPVRIASGRMSVFTGPKVHLERVTIGDGFRIAQVTGHTDFGSLFGEPKTFSRVELEGVTLPQNRLADLLLGSVKGGAMRIERIALKQARLEGPVTLPAIDVEAVLTGSGSVRSVRATGADRFSLEITPKGGEIAFDLSTGNFAVPFVPGLNLVDFGAKGSATRQGMTVSEFDGRAFEGVISGTARIRWGAEWAVEGEARIRGVNAAVFAPTLVSEGKAEGKGIYSMSGADLAKLGPGARLEGSIKIERGVLGSFDLARAIQTSGNQTAGRTMFAELNAQGLYEQGVVQLRNVTIAAGALNAGASLDIGADGALSGRVVADVKTAAQTLRATLNIGGRLQEPMVRR